MELCAEVRFVCLVLSVREMYNTVLCNLMFPMGEGSQSKDCDSEFFIHVVII